MKDYYDVYFILTKFKNELKLDIVKNAIKNTFANRKSFQYLYDYKKIMKDIMDSEKMQILWTTYSNKNTYAKNIRLQTILIVLTDFLNEEVIN